MPNTYTPQTWTDGVSSASAARLAVIESGIQGAWARELGYTEFTANVSVTATTEATANTVVTAPAVTFDGSTSCIIDFFCSQARHSSVTAFISLALYDGASSIGFMTITTANATTGGPHVTLSRRLTPSSASHTFSIRAFVAAGTGTLVAGAGGNGVNIPGYIRVYKA